MHLYGGVGGLTPVEIEVTETALALSLADSDDLAGAVLYARDGRLSIINRDSATTGARVMRLAAQSAAYALAWQASA